MSRDGIDEVKEKSQDTPKPDAGATRVDLGDDLLAERTVMLARTSQEKSVKVAAPSPAAPSEASVEDQLSTARILIGEGILEEAKRVLRRVLLANGESREARELLEEIHEIELKQIFGGEESPRGRLGRRDASASLDISADLVLRELDRDLDLGMFNGDGTETESLSLFSDAKAMEDFGKRMDRDFADAPAGDRIDLGIAFLEMGLPALATRHFEGAVRKLGSEAEPSQDQLVSATGLLAYALIRGGRAFEATLAMQPLLGDAEVSGDRKLDLIYLMGRAQEALGKREVARQWYLQAAEVDSRYRDIQERLGRIEGSASRRGS